MIKGLFITIFVILIFMGMIATATVFAYMIAELIVKMTKKITRRFTDGYR